MNNGKDQTRTSVEVVATADPGSFLALSATQYQLYEPGANIFFNEYDVCVTARYLN